MARGDDRWYEQYLRDLPGDAGRVMRIVYCRTQAELEEAFLHEPQPPPPPRRGFKRKLSRKKT